MTQPTLPPPNQEELARLAEPLRALERRVAEVVVGQSTMIRGLLVGMLCNGHVLLEGVPGLAKTLTVSTLAAGLDCTFKRIQFTPDLLPADLVGTLVYSPRDGTFSPRRGPVFANIVLADEVNRAPAKVQSALLEAMQERQVTIGDETYALPDPFLVLATQNPIEQEGTYPLPEAQVDRFLLKLRVTYPTRAEERAVLDRMAFTRPTALDSRLKEPVLHPRELLAARATVDRVHIDEKVREYIVDLVRATRPEPDRRAGAAESLVDFGASPRATIALALASRAVAMLEGRAFVTPHDVKSVAPDVLRHRVIPSYEAEARELTSDDLVAQILQRVAAP
ncbi:MAG: MoxR family ATPase [Phycisphaeraceae bacterium]|nr:MoxR family ATPase [Phycisphaeraceae bacterium]MBX3406146.1 MoxR family ATPase [Phycisphaeraceae bacterium]